MTQKEAVLQEIEDLHENLDEILDFVQFLKFKKKREKSEMAMASESSLKKDWMNSEENDAWRHL